MAFNFRHAVFWHGEFEPAGRRHRTAGRRHCAVARPGGRVGPHPGGGYARTGSHPCLDGDRAAVARPHHAYTDPDANGARKLVRFFCPAPI